METNAPSVGQIEERRREAEAARDEAGRELEALIARRGELAPEVLAGDPVAKKEFEGVNEKMAEASGRAELAAAALSELEAREEEERRREEEELLEELRERYDALAERRVGIEERAQEALEALVGVLDELEGVDVEQLILSPEIPHLNRSRITTDFVLARWLQAHLYAHMSGVAPVPDFLKPLHELNPLDSRAQRPAEIQAVQERNAREIAERAERDASEREEGERARAIRDYHDALMSRYPDGDPDGLEAHRREFVVPRILEVYGEDAGSVLGIEALERAAASVKGDS